MPTEISKTRVTIKRTLYIFGLLAVLAGAYLSFEGWTTEIYNENSKWDRVSGILFGALLLGSGLISVLVAFLMRKTRRTP